MRYVFLWIFQFWVDDQFKYLYFFLLCTWIFSGPTVYMQAVLVHCSSRIIGYGTPKIMYFQYQKMQFLDQSIQKIVLFDFENRSTACRVEQSETMPISWSQLLQLCAAVDGFVRALRQAGNAAAQQSIDQTSQQRWCSDTFFCRKRAARVERWSV